MLRDESKLAIGLSRGTYFYQRNSDLDRSINVKKILSTNVWSYFFHYKATTIICRSVEVSNSLTVNKMVLYFNNHTQLYLTDFLSFISL